MITCWGETFKSVQDLWEFPRCYTPTVHSLRHRLKTMSPERAVVPDFFKLVDIRCPNIQCLHRECGDLISLSELYRRLGLIYNGRKLPPNTVVFERLWDRYKQMELTGSYYTIYKMPRI